MSRVWIHTTHKHDLERLKNELKHTQWDLIPEPISVINLKKEPEEVLTIEISPSMLTRIEISIIRGEEWFVRVFKKFGDKEPIREKEFAPTYDALMKKIKRGIRKNKDAQKKKIPPREKEEHE